MPEVGCNIVPRRNGKVITRHDINVLSLDTDIPVGRTDGDSRKGIDIYFAKGLSMEMARLSDDMDMEYSPCSSVNSMPPIAFLTLSGRSPLRIVGAKLLIVFHTGDIPMMASVELVGRRKRWNDRLRTK